MKNYPFAIEKLRKTLYNYSAFPVENLLKTTKRLICPGCLGMEVQGCNPLLANPKEMREFFLKYDYNSLEQQAGLQCTK